VTASQNLSFALVIYRNGAPLAEIPLQQGVGAAIFEEMTTPPSVPGKPLALAVKAWTDHDITVNRRSPLEARKAASTVLRVAADCGWKTVGDMTRADAVRWLRKFIRSGGEGAAKTAHNHRARLRSFAGYLAETSEAPPDLFDGIRLPAARMARGASAFTWDETARLIAQARQNERTDRRAGKYGPLRSTFYPVLALTGLRYSEARHQKWADVNLERRILTVTADKSRRRDPLRYNAECAAALRAWKKYSRGSLLFPRTPSHHTLVADMAACGIPSADAGKKGQWHRFRKALCSELAAQGVDLEERRKAMRHKDVRITADIYTDSEIVEKRVSAAETMGLLPRLRDSSPKRWTDGGGFPDDEDAKAMIPTSPNIVKQTSAACPGGMALARQITREPRSSDSQCQRTGTQTNGAGGNRNPRKHDGDDRPSARGPDPRPPAAACRPRLRCSLNHHPAGLSHLLHAARTVECPDGPTPTEPRALEVAAENLSAAGAFETLAALAIAAAAAVATALPAAPTAIDESPISPACPHDAGQSTPPQRQAGSWGGFFFTT